MGLEDLIAQMYAKNLDLPLGYGQMWNNTYKPAYDFQNQMGSNNANFQSSQGNNRAGIAQSGIGATGNIGSSAISGYGGVASLDAQAQQFNSLSPVLSGLMSQYAPAGSAALPSIAPMQQNYLGGYGNMVNQGYQNVNSQVQGGYGEMDKNQSEYGNAQDKVRTDFGDAFRDQMKRMPKNPWDNKAPDPVPPGPPQYPPPDMGSGMYYPNGRADGNPNNGNMPGFPNGGPGPRTGGGYPLPDQMYGEYDDGPRDMRYRGPTGTMQSSPYKPTSNEGVRYMK
jgi:hypothetical protein